MRINDLLLLFLDAINRILDSLDDINCLSDGVASRDVDFMQHIFLDKMLHELMEVVLF